MTLEGLSEREVELIRQEIEFCFVLQEDACRYIIKVTDIFEDEDTVNIVMEFFEGKSLYQWLK